ncbi:VAMP-associated protein [Wolfiporia cocos MD-104 SS10]|uniref:VAMP-associated protein n=1 Tax=Wolfiporia cocos (strain MD-104) TaxID=742152 RepID=A0A2H3JR48_WOLCO|nr:VAMP-associated protein [Wolfiporia cocos MD-104 SS10]
MSVALTPSNSLGFNRPLTQHVKRSLAITNNNDQPVAFKVKTTAPKTYCVRPNSGRVEPGETVEVQVMLQAMKEEPPLNVKCKDKFLIQSTLISSEKESMSLQDIWNDVTEEVHSQKIRVTYLPPEGQTVPEEPEEGPLNGKPSDLANYGTVRQHPAGNGHAETVREPSGDSGAGHHEEDIHHDAPSTPPQQLITHGRDSSREDLPVHAREEDVGIVNVSVHTPQPPQSLAPSTSTRDPNPDLLVKLEEAQAEIERLRNLISTMPEPSVAPPTTVSGATEFRRRRPLSPSEDGSSWDGQTEVGTTVEEVMVQPEGVPLQVVVVIALGVFVTTYLFF